MTNRAKSENISLDEARAKTQAGLPTGRFGDPVDFGATCAFMCSEHVKFMVGQNVLLDGGAFNSTMG